MVGLSHQEMVILLLSLGVLLGTARLLGELAMRWRQPAVLGELLAGIVLGPTVLGSVAPAWFRFLFPPEGNVPIALNSLGSIAIILFLLVVGMEVDLATVWRQGKAALSIGVMGIVVPFGSGFVAAYYFPDWLGAEGTVPPILFALFVATALSISALPVIAKTLIDLSLFRTDLGMAVISAAIFNDLIGWMIFAMILAMMGQHGGLTIYATISLTLGFIFFSLTAGRWLMDRILPWILAHSSWPGGVLGFALTCALFCAAFTEWIGIHAIFGAFIFGIVLGDSRHFRERTRATIDQFVSFIFAPLFFATIGLRVDFVASLDIVLVSTVLVLATAGKVLGCGWAAHWAGFSRGEAWAAGLAMNSRGVMEIILGLLALQVGLIGERLFVALVIMALVTSMSSGSLIQFCLRRRKVPRFIDYLSSKNSFTRLETENFRAALHQLVQMACRDRDLDARQVERLVAAREQIAETTLPQGIAVPHARLAEIEQPIVVVGLSESGVKWLQDAQTPPIYLVVLLLTPKSDSRIQLDLLADVARTFPDRRRVELARTSATYTELLACINSDLE